MGQLWSNGLFLYKSLAKDGFTILKSCGKRKKKREEKEEEEEKGKDDVDYHNRDRMRSAKLKIFTPQLFTGKVCPALDLP